MQIAVIAVLFFVFILSVEARYRGAYDRYLHSQLEANHRDAQIAKEVDFSKCYEVADALRLKKGSSLLMKGSFPCKVIDVSALLTKEEGRTKIKVIGKNIITGEEYEEKFEMNERILKPIMDKQQYELVDVDDDVFHLMDENLPSVYVKVSDAKMIDAVIKVRNDHPYDGIFVRVLKMCNGNLVPQYHVLDYHVLPNYHA